MEDCTITGIGEEYRGAVGVMVALVRDTTLLHTTVANCSYTGVSVGWGWNRDKHHATYMRNISIINSSVSNSPSNIEFCDGGSICACDRLPLPPRLTLVINIRSVRLFFDDV